PVCSCVERCWRTGCSNKNWPATPSTRRRSAIASSSECSERSSSSQRRRCSLLDRSCHLNANGNTVYDRREIDGRSGSGNQIHFEAVDAADARNSDGDVAEKIGEDFLSDRFGRPNFLQRVVQL